MVVYLIVFIYVLAACAQDHGTTAQQQKGPAALVFATAEQLETGAVVEHSYVVGFRAEGQGLWGESGVEVSVPHRFLLGRDQGLQGLESPLALLMQGMEGESTPVVVSQVDFASQEEAELLLTQWWQEQRIEFAEPNYTSQMQDYSQWVERYQGAAEWLQQIKVLAALEYLAEQLVSPKVEPLIAVLDSGMDYKHPELLESVWQNPGAQATGCLNDVYGCNTTQAFKADLGDGSVEPAGLDSAGQSCRGVDSGEEVCLHGTHVAGIIASRSDTGGGVCPVCRVLPVKIVGDPRIGGSGSQSSVADSSIIAALHYIAQLNEIYPDDAIRVVNASFGKFQRSRVVERQIRKLFSRGTLVIAAAGNEDTDRRAYPAAFSDVIAVANVADDGVKAQSSNYGIWVDIAAPGQSISSTVPGGSSKLSSGTSMSAPVVAGVAGLVLSAEPGLGAEALKQRLLESSDPSLYEQVGNRAYIPHISEEPAAVPLLGVGVVDAERAVKNEVGSLLQLGLATRKVRAQCGVLGSAMTGWLWLWLLVPVWFGLWFRNLN